MNKFVLFILSALLGIIYEWSSIPIAWFSAFLFTPSSPIIGFVFFLPLIFCFLTARYFLHKKKGWAPIIGLVLGLLIGFILLGIGMSGA